MEGELQDRPSQIRLGFWQHLEKQILQVSKVCYTLKDTNYGTVYSTTVGIFISVTHFMITIVSLGIIMN